VEFTCLSGDYLEITNSECDTLPHMCLEYELKLKGLVSGTICLEFV
jgi:hypothetical protein